MNILTTMMNIWVIYTNCVMLLVIIRHLMYDLGDFYATMQLLLMNRNILCNRTSLILSDCVKLPVYIFTYVNKAHFTMSWLIHCLTENTCYEKVKHIELYYDSVKVSHLQIFVIDDCNINVFTNLSNASNLNFFLKNITDEDISENDIIIDGFLT